MSVEGSITKLLKEATEKKQEAQRLQALLDQYPDLKVVYPGRSRTPHYSSASLNPQVDKVNVTLMCSCCPDPGVVAYFWKQTELGSVYSDSPRFDVGDHWNYSDHPRPGWKDTLRKACISETAIEEVAAHFREQAQERLDAAQEDLDRTLESIDDG